MKNVKIVAFNSRRAFTLIEIMIVVVLIGILLAIAFPNLTISRKTAIKNICLTNIKQIQSALTMAALETNAATDNLSADGIKAVIEPVYMRHMPNCKCGIYSTNDSRRVCCSEHSPIGVGG